MLTIGVCLSGCGVKDGSEIQEATLTLLAIDQAGAHYQCFAPNIEQVLAVDHATGKASKESRNVLSESARIARGDIQDLAKADPKILDAIIFPGGFGAALNLCSFAKDGPDCSVNADVLKLINAMMDARKTIAAICIAPVVLAKAFELRNRSVYLTIGNDKGVSSAIEAMGCKHSVCAVDQCVVDQANKVVTTPAYMLASRPSEVYAGIKALVDEVVRLCN